MSRIVRYRTMKQEIPTPILIKEASKKFHSAMEASFKDAGIDELRPLEGRILHYLVAHPGCSSGEICETLLLSKSSVSETLASLTEKGFTTYEVNNENRREKQIEVTPKGLAHQNKVDDIIQSLIERSFDGIDDEDIQRTRRALIRIIKNLERREP